MTFKWNENVTLKFLEEYKKHECLWNSNSAHYYDCCSKKEAIRYEEEQSKILHRLCSGKPYKSNLPWYTLMEEMLTKNLSNEINETPKVTICTNSVPDKTKKVQISEKKKPKSNVLSPAIQVTNHPCGYKVIKKLVKEKNSLNKKGRKKIMSNNYTNYVPCPGIGNSNSFSRLYDRREIDDNITKTGLNNYPLESICIREIKKRRDIPRMNLQTKSTECSCCRQNSENNHYAAKNNYNFSKKMVPCPSYFSKEKNSDLNYNEFRNQYSNDQHQLRTRFVPCSNGLKHPDQLFSTNQRNSYNYSKNMEIYTPERTTCGNNFHKTTELYPRQLQEFPQHDKDLNRQSCLRNGDQIFPTTDYQGIVQFTPRVATKFENGKFEAVSQFKINIQCGEKGLDNRNIHPKTNRETQTFLERKQQSVCTNLVNFDTKETQHGFERHSKQTGINFEDFNQNIQNTVCVSRSQADEMKKNLSDYILLMPGGKSLRLSKKSSREKFVECTGTSENRFINDEVFSVCTEASCMTQESRFVDSDTMATPQLIQCVEEMLNIRSNQDLQAEEIESVTLSRTENREVEEKESQCGACKNFENEDKDLRFCFRKLFNRDLSTSDCFPCLKEKIDKESSGELTKTFLTILKYALDLDNKTENNLKGCRFKSKIKMEMIKKICKCIKKFSDVEATKATRKNFLSKDTQIEENRKYSKEVSTEKEPSISRSVNAVPKNVGVTKQVETENEALISRSMNTFVEETPVEVRQTILENVETNTDVPNHQKEVGTTPMENIRLDDASTQVIEHLSPKMTNKGKSIETQKIDPILVRVVSAPDRQKLKTQSKSSQSVQSGADECKNNGYKRVCFSEKKEFEFPKQDFRCGVECKHLNIDCSKIRITDKNNSRIKKKVMDNKLTEVPKSKGLANRKKIATSFTHHMKKYENPYVAECDRHCYLI